MHHNEGRHGAFLGCRPAPFTKILAQSGIDFRGLRGRRRSVRFATFAFAVAAATLCDRRPSAEPLRAAPANVARPARCPFRILAEMDTDLPMAAVAGIHEGADLVIALPRPLFFDGILDLPDEMGQQPSVLLLPEQNAIGGLTVAPRTARLLIVLFNRFRQGKMNHRTHRSL